MDEVLMIVNSYVKRIPPDALKTVRSVLPSIQDALKLCDLDEKAGEVGVCFILNPTGTNIELHLAVQAVKIIDGEELIVITRTLGEAVNILPDEK